MAEKKTGTSFSTKQRLPWPALLVFLSLAVIIAVSSYFFYRRQKNEVFREEIIKLNTIANLKVSQIKIWLGERLADARLISQNPVRCAILSAFLRDRSNASRRESVQQWLSSLQTIYHYENVLLLDWQGELVLAASPHHAMVGDEGRQALVSARRRRDVVMSELHRNPQVPHIHLDIITPLFAGEKNSGFVILRVDPNDFLFPMIQAWPTASPSAETLLVRREGDSVLFLNELRHRRNTALNLRLPITSRDLPAAMAIKGIRGAFSGSDYRGVTVWSVVRPVEGTSWFMVAKIDKDEIELPMRRNILAIFLVALALVLAVAMLILYLWQRQESRFRFSQLEMLRESEENFKAVFETANVGKSITQPTGELQVNQAFCDMLGYSREELQRKKWQEITPPEEIVGIELLLEPLLGGRKDGIRFNKRYIHKNGSHVWGDVSVAIQRDQAGKPLHFITTIVDITERKQAEDALKTSETKLRNVLDATPFPIAIVDLNDDKIDYWSRSALTLFGHTAPTAAQWYEIAYPDPDYRRDVVERWKPFLEKARLSGQAVNTGEYRVSCRDGSVRICELFATFLAESLIVTFNDVTKRKQAEKDLQMAYKRLRTFIDANIVGIVIASPTGQIIEANDYYLELIGAGRDEFDRGLVDWRVTTPPEWLAADERALRELKETGKCRPYEKEYARPDGKRVPVYIVDAMLPGPEEQIAAFVLDLSERKRAEDEIRALSARNQALLEAVPDIIMEVDTNKVYTWANRAGIEFFGDEVIGREAGDYFLGEQEVYQVVKPLFNGYEDTIYLESWQRRRDGEKRLLAWWCRVLKDAAGNVTGALSSARDITEIKLAENEIRRLNEELEQRVLQRTALLEASNKELESFSYSVSHDLRAPLRAIGGFARIVLEEYASKLDDEGRRLLGVITGNTEKMGHLIDDLLAFSRLSRQQITLAPVDLTALAKTVFHELQGSEKGRRIEFKVGKLPPALGDHTMLGLVLLNLLANAIKFSRPITKPRIEMTGWEGSGENIYQVKDNGVGFDMAYADKLFGVFQRLHSSDEFEGTGVGLAIVQRIILRHGGRVWAESSAKDGATFYFSLPLAAPGATATSKQKSLDTQRVK